MNRPNFGKPPPGYVAGLGRGATGFTTRSDIGPARAAVGNSDGVVTGVGRGAGMPAPEKPPEQNFSDANFNSWSGYEGSLFSKSGYDQEDNEADDILERVEIYMDGRRSEKRKKNMEKELDQIQKEAPKYSEKFTDLRRQLANVTEDEWEKIPEQVDRSNKRVKAERFTPVSDSAIDSARFGGETVNFLDPNAGDGSESNPMQTPMTNLSELGEARKMNLGLKLDKMSGTVSGLNSLNKDGYLTDLGAMKINSATEINDIKKAKLLMKSVRKNHPDSPYGWISSARIEELDGKTEAAREIIAQACDKFPFSEDVWAEAARMMPPEEGRQILVKAIKNMPKAKKLWMAMANIEKTKEQKIKVYRKALTYISTDVELWKAAIELEDQEEAKSLLYKAIECVPQSTSIWIALAKLEDYKNARKVLNKAAKTIPTDHTIWVHAAKLEEAEGNYEMVPKLIRKGIKNLKGAQIKQAGGSETIKSVKVTRDQWLKEAFEAEMASSVVTARALISETLYEGIDDPTDMDENKKIWFETADNFLNRGAIECARELILCACKALPKDVTAWMKAKNLEDEYGNMKSQGKILKQALENCDDIEVFYLMYAKHLWKKEKDIDGAIKTILDGLHNLDDEEELYLALNKLYKEKRQYDDARELLNRGRLKCDSQRIWMQSAQIEREVGDPKQAGKILETAIEKYPGFYKLHLIAATLKIEEGEYDEARKIYENSVKVCKPNPHLWICYAQMEQQLDNFAKARAILQKGRIKLPKNELLWLETIRLEIRANNLKVATHLCSKALQQCPDSGQIWVYAIELEPVQQRKAKSLNAVNATDKRDPYVCVEVAKLFWREKKYDKTHKWLKQAVTLNKDIGDSWAYLYKFELENGDEESQNQVLKECVEQEPHHGENWCAISKQVCNWRLSPEEILKQVVQIIEV